jgi:hypothetical protein
MGAPVRESDDGKSSKTDPPKNGLAKDTPRDVGVTPSSCATEVPEPPWKRKSRSNVFEGDAALVELRSRLALKAERLPEPAVPISTAPMFSGALRLLSGVAIAAVIVGIAGHLLGFKLSIKMPELTSASGQSDVSPASSSPGASPTTKNRDFDSPAATRTAPIGPRGAANPVTSVDAARRSASLPTRPQPVSPSVAARLPVAAEDA